MTKAVLRHEIRARLRLADRSALLAASARICQAVESTPSWRDTRLVCAFVPLRSEPQIQPLWQSESGPAFCFPRIVGDGVELIRIDDRAALARAGWKLDDPDFDACPRILPAQLDAILVPGLGFTRGGQRLGRGGGHYDRLLAQCQPQTTRLGVAFEMQIFDVLPLEPHDQRLDVVFTEAS